MSLPAKPPFNDSDTALRDSAFLQSEAKPQVVSEAKDNFRKDDDVRWQWSGATWTTRQGCPEGDRGGVHQFRVPPIRSKDARRKLANRFKEIGSVCIFLHFVENTHAMGGRFCFVG